MNSNKLNGTDNEKSKKRYSESLKSDFPVSTEQLQSKVEKQKDEIAKLKEELSYYKLHYKTAMEQREDLKRQLRCVTNEYETISKSAFWRITKPFRVILDIIKYPFKKAFRLLKKFLKSWRKYGFSYTVKKVFKRLRNSKAASRPLYTQDELEAQRSEVFSRDIKFSIIAIWSLSQTSA